jgi:hypothetical protein
MTELPPGTGKSYMFRLDAVKSIAEAERITGLKAKRPARGTFQGVFVGPIFGYPAIAVTHRTGPNPTDVETAITEREVPPRAKK